MEKQYYNAKPSNITNIGLDVSGAKRHNFDTYETSEERETRKRKASNDKTQKEAYKNAILSESPDAQLIIKLLKDKFFNNYGFCAYDANARSIIMNKRQNIEHTPEARKAFNAMISAYNKTIRAISDCNSEYRFKRFITSQSKKYRSKEKFVGQSGVKFDWKLFEATSDIHTHLEYLKNNANAVQFGNSVSDKERGYIAKQLSQFINQWQNMESVNKIDITKINWSFGARGNAQSVAFYCHSNRVISVNRNNIGSLIHEIGHYIDFTSGMLSNKISYSTIRAYAETLPEYMQGSELRYYCSRVEIFARAFEAYSYKMNYSFSKFAQYGNQYLPELNDELIALIESVIR